MILPSQIRGARGMLGMSAAELAAAAGISVNGLGNIERGASDPKISTLAAIENALRQRGVEFIPDGVRLVR